MTGCRSLLARLVPTAPHHSAGMAVGRPVADEFRVLNAQISDAATTALRLKAAILQANPQDPNLQTINDVLERLV